MPWLVVYGIYTAPISEHAHVRDMYSFGEIWIKFSQLRCVFMFLMCLLIWRYCLFLLAYQHEPRCEIEYFYFQNTCGKKTMEEINHICRRDALTEQESFRVKINIHRLVNN